MCGIVGLFAKNSEFEKKLGEYLSSMLIEMEGRGQDSAGIAIYNDELAVGDCKITLLSEDVNYDWQELEKILRKEFSMISLIAMKSHAILTLSESAQDFANWLKQNRPELSINSSGQAIEIFKEKGIPEKIIKNYNIRSMHGTHALGHTRMATESVVTTEHSHPFSTGADVCLVHNGSLSNHNTLRRNLQKKGIKFSTDNDSEVAAGYLSWRISEGDDIDTALKNAMKELDGFYTFVVGTKDGFAVLRDPIGCKPAVVAETDDWVAIASEFHAIATLPGAENASIWEPEPAKIYSWNRS